MFLFLLVLRRTSFFYGVHSTIFQGVCLSFSVLEWAVVMFQAISSSYRRGGGGRWRREMPALRYSAGHLVLASGGGAAGVVAGGGCSGGAAYRLRQRW